MPAICKIDKTIVRKSPPIRPINNSLKIAKIKFTALGVKSRGGIRGKRKNTIKSVIADLIDIGIVACEKNGKKAMVLNLSLK